MLTEAYGTLSPTVIANEVNLALIWSLLVVLFAYRVLLSLNRLYFQMEEGGERSLVVMMGFVYLLLAMMILIVPEETLETGLDEAYETFNRSAAVFLADNAGLDSRYTVKHHAENMLSITKCFSPISVVLRRSLCSSSA